MIECVCYMTVDIHFTSNSNSQHGVSDRVKYTAIVLGDHLNTISVVNHNPWLMIVSHQKVSPNHQI